MPIQHEPKQPVADGRQPIKSFAEPAHLTRARRYWRRADTPQSWWPWGFLPAAGLAVLFLFGALVTAPRIEADVREQVASNGQHVIVRAEAPQRDTVYLQALARSTQCDTRAGRLTCPTLVDVVLEPPEAALARLGVDVDRVTALGLGAVRPIADNTKADGRAKNRRIAIIIDQAEKVEVERDGPQILSAALYGNKDDLKLISGVGPKLEKLLNKNGVFYFWQVAEWDARDIDVIDERLDVFKGRIARDDWVSQAKQLRHTPGAASMPAG